MKTLSLFLIFVFSFTNHIYGLALSPAQREIVQKNSNSFLSLQTLVQANSQSRRYLYPAGNLDITLTNSNRNYVKTSAGAISVGMSMHFRMLFPEANDYPNIIIAPKGSWIGEDGTNLMQIYFSISCNSSVFKRKTKIVCRPDQKQRIIEYLKSGNPYYLPNPDGYLNASQIAGFRKEALYLADRTTVEGKQRITVPYLDRVEFVEFSPNGLAQTGDIKITDLQDESFLVSEKDNPRAIVGNNQMKGVSVKIHNAAALVEKPDFGITFLGTSNGMDANGLTSNQIIWAGDKHILVDAGPTTLPALESLGLSPLDITDVIMTHMHEDHVAGIFEFLKKCKDLNHRVNIIMEPGIYEFLKMQARQILNGQELENAYDISYTPLHFYQRLFLGNEENIVTIDAIPAFHGTPTTMFRLTYKGKTISHSSDTAFDDFRFFKILSGQIPENVKEDLETDGCLQKGETVFNESRARELSEFLFANNDLGLPPALIIYEAGTSAVYDKNTSNHTTPFMLNRLTKELQQRMVVNHTPKLPEGIAFDFSLARPLSTIVIDSFANKATDISA